MDADGAVVPRGAALQSRHYSGALLYVTYSVPGTRGQLHQFSRDAYLQDAWSLLLDAPGSLLFAKAAEGAAVFPSDHAVVVASGSVQAVLGLTTGTARVEASARAGVPLDQVIDHTAPPLVPADAAGRGRPGAGSSQTSGPPGQPGGAAPPGGSATPGSDAHQAGDDGRGSGPSGGSSGQPPPEATSSSRPDEHGGGAETGGPASTNPGRDKRGGNGGDGSGKSSTTTSTSRSSR